MEAGLEELDSADRGFVTWLAAMAREPVDEMWERLLGTVQHGPGTRVEDGHLVSLDLTPVGPSMRWAVGPDRRLSPPVAGLDRLEILDCSGLDLDALDVRLLPRLRVLRCGDNRLRELDLGSATLRELDCSGNQLMLLDLRGCGALEVLDCSGNGLGALVLPEGAALQRLDCSRNQIMVLDLGSQPRLEELRCFRNALAHLTLTAAPQLRHLDASRNDLEVLELPPLPSLQHLAVERNRLPTLPLAGVPVLRELRCAGNYVDQLDLAALGDLQVVDASSNQLTEVALGQHPGLVELCLGENRLERLALGGLHALEVLRVAGNELEALDLGAQQRLCLLDCSENVLSELDVSSAPGLAELRCDGNPLRELDIRGNPELCRLRSRGLRDDPPRVLATDVQCRRLRELRESRGLGTGATSVQEMDPFELHDHAIAVHGRDTEAQLMEVVVHPRCDLGTALLVYWISSPHYYRRYLSRDEVQAYEAPGWDLLATIEARVLADDFSSRQIWFDPHNDKQTRSVRGVDWTLDDRIVKGPSPRQLPAYMMRATDLRPPTS